MKFPRNIFMPFVVLGDPNYEESIKLIKLLIDNGAGALELGFAFSDPIADGPIIQRANKRALENNMTTQKAFEILNVIRNFSSIPISLMISFNIIYNYGVEKFYIKCSDLKINAILCPDIPLEESDELVKIANKYKINQIFLISPSTTQERLADLRKVASGYIYLVSLLGTTGIRAELDKYLSDLIERSKKYFDIPIYVGFGISSPEQVKNVLAFGADGTICGSAICKIIEENISDPEKMREIVQEFCKNMCMSLKK